MSKADLDVDLLLVHEAVLDVTLYHGSQRRLDMIKPDSVNAGTILSKPRWSAFFWRERERALSWAVFSLVREVFRERRKELGLTRIGYDPPSGKAMVLATEMEIWKRATRDRSVFVYTVDVPAWHVGMGHTPDIEEYTVDEQMTPRDAYEARVTPQLLTDRMLQFQSADAMREHLSRLEVGKQSRFGHFLMHDDHYDRFNDLSRRAAKGEIQPGQAII